MSSAWTHGPSIAANVSQRPRRMLIGDQWRESVSGDTIPVIDPATERQVAAIQRGGRADVDLAVASARQALERGPWPQMNGAVRAKLLWKLADLVEQHRDELAMLETLDNGKPLLIAQTVDVTAAAEKLRYASGWATKITGQTLSPLTPGDSHAFTLREPVGVAALIVPWNFPLMSAVSKLADALAAGCTTVLKPSEQTSLSALRLGELIQSAGFPDGVVNIITGYGPEAGLALAEHPGVDKVSFTGSTAVGRKLLGAAMGNLKRITLELGGKSPAIVFADADFEVACKGVLRNIFANAGQMCTAGSRVYAERPIYERLLVELAAHAQALQIGPGIRPDTQMGPLVSKQQLDRVAAYVSGAVEAGAALVTGGRRHGPVGFFIEPTILADTTAAMPVRREEIFGPVLCITPFDGDDLDALVHEANDTDYGLSAYVYTMSLRRAHLMSRSLKAGLVRVNAAPFDMTVPFGGYKLSGWGRENGLDGILEFTELKSVVMAL